MTTTARAYSDPQVFAAAADATLASQPLRHSIIATALARTLRFGPRPGDRWWVITESADAPETEGSDSADAPVEQVVGLAMLTRTGRPYLATDATHGQAVGAAVAADLLATPPSEPITGVNGFSSAARAFAQEWVQARGGAVRAGRQDVLYDLPGPVRMPHGVPGAARVATDADRDLLDGWGRAFIRDIGDPPDPSVTMARPLAEGGVMIWEADAGEGVEPLSMAFANAPTYGHTRLSWVWTRPERRGRGFGGAITAAVSARAQGDGLRCLLIGDSRDQVSGTMFRKLGYQVADDSCHLHFDRA